MAVEEFNERRRLAEYFKQEAKRELEYANLLNNTSSRSQNPVVRLVIDAVSQDSIKHSKIYETMAALIMNPGLIDEAESAGVLNDIEKHISMEAESLKELERLKSEEIIKRDAALSFLIDMLLRDESFHHAVLRQLYNALIKNITLTEQDIWEAVWRDAVYHGTPGG
ncbi:MAG: hypothetical protein ACP5FT_03860 [Acidilobus sp.]